MAITEKLSDDEAYLWAILSDPSGLDQAEFSWVDPENDDYCFRAWPFQWKWWRDTSPNQIDQAARSVGKTLSIRVRAFAFPFIHPGQEMVLTAPEGNHLDAITDNVETVFLNNRMGREMLVDKRGNGIKHRPFHVNFNNGSRIMGRIPQRDGRGVKGCAKSDGPVLTRDDGFKRADEVVVGDLVMNHKGRWVPVTEVHHDVNDCYKVEGLGSFPLEVSCDHRFYGSYNRGTVKTKRDFSGLYFEDVECLLEDQFHWATPTEIPHVDPIYPQFSDVAKSYDVKSEEFWWLAGLYVADGYVRANGSKYGLSAINWVSHPQNIARRKLIRCLERLGCSYRITKREHSTADTVELASHSIAEWIADEFGRSAISKQLPTYMYSLPVEFRHAFADGYLSGDGHWDEKRGRWTVSSASKNLMMGFQLLFQTLGFKVASCGSIEPNVSHINGVALKNKPLTSWRMSISDVGLMHPVDDYLVGRIKKVTPIGKQPVVNIVVDDEHSYLTGTIMSHNIHPVWLELDEAQDYPDKGWIELFETVKQGSVGNLWRAHGVTRGVRDYFFKFTQDSNWKVHQYSAMYRPTWTDAERQSQIEKYGSRNHPDYRRNVLGLHGDATNPLFVLHRLLACVDDDLGSDFNSEYQHLDIKNEMVLDEGDDILPLLDFPASHLKHKNVWVGVDLGYCVDAETQIFTQSGWKNWNEIVSGDTTLSINPETGKSEWDYIYKTYAGTSDSNDLKRFKGQTFDALTTKNHRWLTQNSSGKWVWRTSETLNTKSLIPYAVERSDIQTEKFFSDGFVEVLAWFMSEGHFVCKSISFGQSNKVNPGSVERIRKTLFRLYGAPGKLPFGPHRKPLPDEARYSETVRPDGMVYWYFSQETSRSYLSLVGPEKEILPEALCAFTENQLDLFLEVSNIADGWTQHGARKFEQYSLARTKTYEMVAVLRGLPVSTHYESKRGRWQTALLKCPHVNPVFSSRIKTLTENGMSIEDTGTDAVMWCPATRNKNWLARRNGSIYFTGNTQDPTEILVFSELPDKNKNTILNLISRISLDRINHENQVATLLWVLNFYKPKALAMDKMQPLSEPILTPSGWRTMGDLVVGDEVIGSDGNPTVVTGYYPQQDRRVRRVVLSDGSSTRCGPEHLWKVEVRRGLFVRRQTVFTTDQLQRLKNDGCTIRFPVISSPLKFSADKCLDDVLIEPDEESACIRVAAEDHLYVTKDHIITHNTGLGLPLFQDIQGRVKSDPNIRHFLDIVKGYNFSEKILVDYDDSIEVDEFLGEPVDAEIKRNVLEWSTDILRDLIDAKRMWLPYDKELIGEFEGQTYTYNKATMDLYGRSRSFSKGTFHALDAARMAVLGWKQHSIEDSTKVQKFEPTTTIFLD